MAQRICSRRAERARLIQETQEELERQFAQYAGRERGPTTLTLDAKLPGSAAPGQ
jgi:hypothetical protein